MHDSRDLECSGDRTADLLSLGAGQVLYMVVLMKVIMVLVFL